MLLSMESTSNRMSRLGKSVVTGTELLGLEEIIARIDAVQADEVAALRSRPARPRRAVGGRHRPERGRFRAAVERVNPALSTPAAA